MLKKMNLPNKLTCLRIVLVPIFVIFMALPKEWIWNYFVAFGIYVIAAITDFLDGILARKNDEITKFGKIMDPLADKLIISAAFIMLAGLNVIPAWIACLLVFRDFFVNSLRMFGADNDKDIAASLSGKLKTVFQLVAGVFAIFGLAYSNVAGEVIINIGSFINALNTDILATLINVIMSMAMIGVVVTTVWSLVDYIIRFKKDVNVEE